MDTDLAVSTLRPPWRRYGLRCALVLFAACLAAQHAGHADGYVRAPQKRDISAIRNRLEREIEETRRRRTEAHAERGLRQFVDKNGVATLTNRPARYSSKTRLFREVPTNYNPITVPKRYMTLPAGSYSIEDLRWLVPHYARMHGLSESLVFAVIDVESNFNPYAVSRAGACGLMQLMPGTAADMGITGNEIFDMAKNVGGGTQYLAMCLNMFRGDTRLALAGYNAGPEAVKKHGGVPPYKETVDYIGKVLRCRGEYIRGVPKAKLAGTGKRTMKPNPPKPEVDKKQYTICFHSGLTQLADKVVDDDKHYYVQFEGRMYKIKKHHVKEVIEPA